ncbi:pilus assembly protein TadE [Rhodococcus rhodnii]|uniref:Pilus assembly protein TadE n=1 Tax=Rhodococcus rhodnii TaxID=38312 RepID=A0A6P2C966_9NOCA|nr:Rv3654c family TadE-like protein [Rhodococcus rhodnii]TXG89304.1 pilus assembly protein TadE [Rhodococcus rhodnii]
MTSRANDEGVATVVGAFAIVVLVAATAGVVHVGSAVSARHRAQSVADLAAIAAAVSLDRGEAVACGAARTVARRSAATVDSCDVVAWDVTVEVSVVPALPLSAPARAIARAGPVDE